LNPFIDGLISKAPFPEEMEICCRDSAPLRRPDRFGKLMISCGARRRSGGGVWRRPAGAFWRLGRRWRSSKRGQDDAEKHRNRPLQIWWPRSASSFASQRAAMSRAHNAFSRKGGPSFRQTKKKKKIYKKSHRSRRFGPQFLRGESNRLGWFASRGCRTLLCSAAKVREGAIPPLTVSVTAPEAC